MTDIKIDWSQIFNDSLQGICIIDKNFNVIEANDSFANLFGQRKETLIGLKCYDIYDKDMCTSNCLLKLIFTGEQHTLLERTIAACDGRNLNCLISAKPYYNSNGDLEAIIQEITDVSKLRQTELALTESEKRFKLYVDKSPDGIFVLDQTGKYIDANPQGCSMLGYTREELLQLNVADVDITVREANDFEELANGKMLDQERTLLTKEGNLLKVHLKAVPLGNNFFMGYVRDITSRKQTEAALKMSEDHYRMIFDNSPFGIIHFDQKGTITHFNDKFVEIMGSSKEKITGFNMLQINDDELKDALRTALAGGIGCFEGKYTTVTSGKAFQLKAVFNRISTEEGEFLGGIGVFEDISDKKKIEQELARLDRLNLVGQMSAGIGHEIRNPMTTIRGFLQMLGNTETDNKKREYFELMIEELDRANSIITEFLSLAKDKVVSLMPTSLNMILNSLHPLLAADANKYDVKIVLNKGEISKLPLNEKEIRQLIYNLVRNGLEAMASGGVLTIGTYQRKNEVVLYVEDKGSGIAPDILEKLGNPFVTNKEQGTGLGLAVCYSVANRHNAKIDVQTGSEGTTFYVRFKMPKNQVDKEAS